MVRRAHGRSFYSEQGPPDTAPECTRPLRDGRHEEGGSMPTWDRNSSGLVSLEGFVVDK